MSNMEVEPWEERPLEEVGELARTRGAEATTEAESSLSTSYRQMVDGELPAEEFITLLKAETDRNLRIGNRALKAAKQ